MKISCLSLISVSMLPLASARLLRSSDATAKETSEAARNLQVCDEQNPPDPLDLLYEKIPCALEPWEEIARDTILDTTDERSQTFPTAENNFKILRPKSRGSHITKLTFILEIDGLLINRVDAEFSDGSRDFGGGGAIRGDPKIEVVKIPGKMDGSITVESRTNPDVRVNKLFFDGSGRQIATGQGSLAGPRHTYDVDGRYLTGIITSSTRRMLNLQFIISKEVASSELSNIDYELPSLGGGAEAKSLDTVTLSNDSNEAQTFSVSYTSIESSAFSFSSETTASLSVGFGVTTSITGKVPFVGDFSNQFEFSSSVESTFASGRTEESVQTKEVTKEVSVKVPPKTLTTLTITQFQEWVADIDYTATHIVTFTDGTRHVDNSLKGVMEGVAVSSVFMSTEETPLVSTTT